MKTVTSKLSASEHALRAMGTRPKARVRNDHRNGTKNFKRGHVNQAINILAGHRWVIENDCISFDNGVLISDGKMYRVVTWKGLQHRAGFTPRKALKNAGIEREGW